MSGFPLDTNVISLLAPSRSEASKGFLDWLERPDGEGRVFLSVVTVIACFSFGLLFLANQRVHAESITKFYEDAVCDFIIARQKIAADFIMSKPMGDFSPIKERIEKDFGNKNITYYKYKNDDYEVIFSYNDNLTPYVFLISDVAASKYTEAPSRESILRRFNIENKFTNIFSVSCGMIELEITLEDEKISKSVIQNRF